jgi:hypothetical protein
MWYSCRLVVYAGGGEPLGARKKEENKKRHVDCMPPCCTCRGNDQRQRGRNWGLHGSPLPPRCSRKPGGTTLSSLCACSLLPHTSSPPRSCSAPLLPTIPRVVRVGDVASLGSLGAGDVALLGSVEVSREVTWHSSWLR